MNSEQMKFLLSHGWRNVWLAPGSKDSHASNQNAMEAMLVSYDGRETASIKTRGHRNVFTVSISSLIIKPGKRGAPAGMDARQFKEDYLALGRGEVERSELQTLEKQEEADLPPYFRAMPDDSPARAAIARLVEIKKDLEEYRELLEYSVESANKRIDEVFQEEARKVDEARQLYLEARQRAENISDALNKAVETFTALAKEPETAIQHPAIPVKILQTLETRTEPDPKPRRVLRTSGNHLSDMCRAAVERVTRVGKSGGRYFYASDAAQVLAKQTGVTPSTASINLRKRVGDGHLGKIVAVTRDQVKKDLPDKDTTKHGKPSQWYKILG